MAVNVGALKVAPPDDQRAAELIEECRSRLGGEWRLLHSSIKLSKSIFEAEFNGRRVIGKVSGSKRAQTAFGNVKKLHEAGMRPPALYTVPEPIAWFEDRKLLLLEKAPGTSVVDAFQHETKAEEHVRRAADWLTALHSLHVDLPRHRFDATAAEARADELAAAIDDPRIETTAKAAIRLLEGEPAALAPSHGDYHPMNIYVSPERITTIDFDTVALREPEADVGYFLAQTANFGLMVFDSLNATLALRQMFVACFPNLNRQRICAHMAWALLQSLHYDACILKIKNDKAALMLRAAGAVLRTGSLDPAEA